MFFRSMAVRGLAVEEDAPEPEEAKTPARGALAESGAFSSFAIFSDTDFLVPDVARGG
jgi:hypothetical protein